MRPTPAVSVARSGWSWHSSADLPGESAQSGPMECSRFLLCVRFLHRGLRSFTKRIPPWSISPTFGASTLFHTYHRPAKAPVADPLSLGVQVVLIASQATVPQFHCAWRLGSFKPGTAHTTGVQTAFSSQARETQVHQSCMRVDCKAPPDKGPVKERPRPSSDSMIFPEII